MENTAHKTNPLFAAAAVAVIVASLAAIAHFTGLLPGKSGPESASTATVAAAPAREAASETPAAPPPAAPAKEPPAPPVAPPAPAPQANAIPAPPAGTPPAVCRECGTVKSIRTVSTEGQGTGLGAVAGGVLGGVLGHQIGKGRGNTVATVAGAAGGAYAGHQVEKNVRSEQHLEVSVRFDDGKTRSYRQETGARWQVGDRVRQANGGIVPY
jgi:outer membrane lipoprotein SlyB